MDFKKGNIYAAAPMPSDGSEFSEVLLQQESFRIERIISEGQTTAEGTWYDQATDEWVILLQGDAGVEIEHSDIVKLSQGDYLLIPAHTLHRVVYTSKKPHCVWLALHAK